MDLHAKLNTMSKSELRKYIINNGGLIRYLRDPDEDLQYLAVKNDATNIVYIRNPTINTQRFALDKNINLLRYIKSKEVINEFKYEIIKHILTLVNPENIYFNAIDEAIDFIKILDEYKIKWPELDVIKTSLRADGKIK